MRRTSASVLSWTEDEADDMAREKRSGWGGVERRAEAVNDGARAAEKKRCERSREAAGRSARVLMKEKQGVSARSR